MGQDPSLPHYGESPLILAGAIKPVFFEFQVFYRGHMIHYF